MPDPTDQELVEYYLQRIAQIQDYSPDARMYYLAANERNARNLVDDLRGRPETADWSRPRWIYAIEAVLRVAPHVWDDHEIDYSSLAVELSGWKLDG